MVIVRKRDDRTVDYNELRVFLAIQKAYKKVRPEEDATDDIEKLAKRVTKGVKALAKDEVTVDEVQEVVKDVLLHTWNKDVAKEYIEYATIRKAKRDAQMDVGFQIEKLLGGDKEVINANANKDSRTFSTQRDLMAGQVAKPFGLKMLPARVREAHLRGDLHYHDLDYSPMTAYTNCFDSSTEFVTSEGVKSFNDFKDGDRITVMTASGNWELATVRCYGEQKLNKVLFKRNTVKEVEVLVTSNHRWILSDNTITTNLKVGDKLVDIPEPNFDIDTLDLDSLEYWARGFVFGDGSSCNNNTGIQMRLCGDKKRYLTHFLRLGCTYTSPDYANGDFVVHTSKLKKDKLTGFEGYKKIEAFIQGYLDADGSFRNGNTDYKSIITTASEDGMHVIEKYSALGKYFITSSDDLTGQKTNYVDSRRKTKTYRFLHGNYRNWKVMSIVKDVKVADVWCLEVDNEHSFVLGCGIPTGNCCLVDLEGMLKGGFTMGNAVIGSPKSINTAVAQAAQIVANVASSQYGLITAVVK